MADRQMDVTFPGFTGMESDEEKLERIIDYVYQISEQYRYILSRLAALEEE